MFDEIDIQFYRILQDSDKQNALKDIQNEPGLINLPLVVFYCRYDSQITKDDKIVTLELELDGTAKVPRKRKEIYRINSAWDYRADHGEFIRFLNTPTYNSV
jgi:hypothetical protein